MAVPQTEQEQIQSALVIAGATWVWDDIKKRYRNAETGRYVTSRQAITLRNYYVEIKKGEADRLTRQLSNHNISLQQWVLEMRQLVKEAYIPEYLLAIGGRENMTDTDWARLGQALRDQYSYVDGFGRDVNQGKLSAGQIRTRARMYIAGAIGMFERAQTQSRGLPRLPQYPGDGQTQCRSNCQCHLDIDESEDNWFVYWRLGVAEHCPDCVRLSEEWRPLVVTKQQ